MQTRQSPSLPLLHRLASSANIENYESLSKSALYDILRRQHNMERLQRLENLRKKRERRQRDGMSSCECARRQSFEEEQKYDPIMMTPLQPITFKFKRPNGKIIRFNVDSLCDYLLATGDFNDPESVSGLFYGTVRVR